MLPLKLSCLNFKLPSLTSSREATKWEARADFLSNLFLRLFGIKSKRSFQSFENSKKLLRVFNASSTDYNCVSAIVIDLVLLNVIISL